jgi:hypothetical protein
VFRLRPKYFECSKCCPAVKADQRRTWLPGETTPVQISLGALSPGSHSLSLWLPDSSERLRSDARYSIRLAHDGMWSQGSGLNHLDSFEAPAP